MNLLTQHNRFDAFGRRRVSDATRRERGDFLLRCVDDLHAHGFKMRHIEGLRARHIRCLASLWEERGYSAATLQKYQSYLHTLLIWVGLDQLASMLGSIVRSTLKDPNRLLRVRVATEDKSWESRIEDPLSKLAEIAQDDDRVALCLELQLTFGLRAREAWLLDPRAALTPDALRCQVLPITRGAKGGRPRDIPITSPMQIELLKKACEYVDPRTSTLIPVTRSFRGWSSHFYRICQKHGISRKDGLVTHGLRHSYANMRYEGISGLERPLVAGRPRDPKTKEADARARDQVSLELGHSRRGITSAYLGPNGPLRNPHSTDTARHPATLKEVSPEQAWPSKS